MRRPLLLAACLTLAGASVAPAVEVRSTAELEQALRATPPHDVIVLADGDYATRRPLIIEGRHGTPDRPIAICAGHRGRATISGAAGFVLRDCDHVAIEGLSFAHDADQPAVLLDNCRNVRITRNRFGLRERAAPRHMEHWVYAIGAHSGTNRIDHNFFAGKTNSGSMVFVRGDDATLACSVHDRVDHNHFRDVVFADGRNGHETVRTGGNDLGASGRNSFAIIEENLFEACSGEDEIMSIKSSDNIIRNNTLRNCRGAICLRLGNRTTVSGNFVLADGELKGCGGVKLYGYDHRIFNNYFAGLTGRRHAAPLALVPGTLSAPTTDAIGPRYDDLTTVPPTGARIVFNTWVDCAPLQFGFAPESRRTNIPIRCVFENNIVARTRPSSAPLANLEPVTDLQARDNLGWTCGPAPDGAIAAWFSHADPRMQLDAGIWRLTEASPARDAEVGHANAVAEDVFGRTRTIPRDAGAEEFCREPLRRRPLTPTDVGPDAP